MYQQLFPQEHFITAVSLQTLGSLFQRQGKAAKAREHYEQALAMLNRLYTAEKYPQGHPELERGLNNLAWLLARQGAPKLAWDNLEKAFAMCERLYPEKQYPLGHPSLATSLTNLGVMLRLGGEFEQSKKTFERALVMSERLYPTDLYRQGHPDLIPILLNLAVVMLAQQDYERAIEFLERGSRIQHDLAAAFLAGASEAEALNFAAKLEEMPVLSLLLSTWPQTERPVGELYKHVWMRRRMIHRHLALRQQMLPKAGTPQIRKLYGQNSAHNSNNSEARTRIWPNGSRKVRCSLTCCTMSMFSWTQRFSKKRDQGPDVTSHFCCGLENRCCTLNSARTSQLMRRFPLGGKTSRTRRLVQLSKCGS
jgi:tetratricopeptide (TPR) repeat protein